MGEDMVPGGRRAIGASPGGRGPRKAGPGSSLLRGPVRTLPTVPPPHPPLMGRAALRPNLGMKSVAHSSQRIRSALSVISGRESNGPFAAAKSLMSLAAERPLRVAMKP